MQAEAATAAWRAGINVSRLTDSRPQPVRYLQCRVRMLSLSVLGCGISMRGLRAILWTLLLAVLVGQPAYAGTRIALVIGNSAYRNVTPLTNPVHDAAAMAETFRQARFDVVDVGNDLPVAKLRRLLRDFGARARDADVAVVYYAGHGIEVDGVNYLVPIDAQLETDADVYDEALSLDRILVAVEPARQLRLVILDACRDNPFAKTMKR